MTPEEYLRARGWRHRASDLWQDPTLAHSWAAYNVYDADQAARIQVRRDTDCEQFRRSYMAAEVLRECAERNEKDD